MFLAVASTLIGQNFDFEAGIADWRQEGAAFRGQPYCGAISSSLFAPSKLGGTYWKDLPYPLGQNGRCLLTSILKPSGTSSSSATSPEFTLDRRYRFLSFRIGGTEDAAHERLELQVRVPNGSEAELLRQIREWWRSAPAVALPEAELRLYNDYVIAAAATGHGTEALRQDVIEIPDFLRGLRARVRVLDDSTGHINVDLIRFTDEPPPPLRVPVWGFADYHTHPMSYMAFGGLKGISTLWGIPGGNVEDYTDPTAISRDIPHCVRGHHGGSFAEAFINGSQLLHYDFPSIVRSILFPHKRHGGPEFDDFPNHLMGAHQQMHITQIRRSYDGGLRLMVGLATDNMAAQFLTGIVRNGHIDLVKEKTSLEAQLLGMKQLAEKNKKWMEIAYSSEDARRIILHNKLALILGVEVDQLGELRLGTDEMEPRLEADYLWGLGARAVIPIHAVNNKLGGPSVFIGPYNWLNDLTHRDNKDATESEVSATKPHYFQVYEDSATCELKPEMIRGACVLNALPQFPELQVAIGNPPLNLFRRSPVIHFAAPVKEYKTKDGYGHKNQKGLEDFGKIYIAELMNRGMILDTAHMSDKSVEDTFSEIGKRLAIQHPGCEGFSFHSDSMPACDADAYPAIISHAHFRGQAIYGDTKVQEYLPSEYDISDRNLTMVQRVGGVVGPFVTEPRIDPQSPHLAPGIDIDCGNSSKNFAHSFHYASMAVNTDADLAAGVSRVGMATDMTFIPMVSPRFGPDACDGAKAFKKGGSEQRAHPELYNRHAQQRPIQYVDPKQGGEVSQREALEPSRMGQRIFDFNRDGLAHYGLLPDMLQDLKDLGDADLNTLMRSAEGYLQMWEKVERLGGTLGGGRGIGNGKP